MLIEIHVIQDHGPSNMNRGEDGRPKTAFYAGTQRLRISSQCWKRALRQPRPAGHRDVETGVFERTVGSSHFGVRTKLLPEKVAQRWVELHGTEAPFVEGIKAAVSVVAKKDGKAEDAKGDGKVRTPQAIYLDLTREVERIIVELNRLHEAGELELLADESVVFAGHLSDAVRQANWDGKDPSKLLAWESLRAEANWKQITEACEKLDIADRPVGLDPDLDADALTPSFDVAVGLLTLLQRLSETDDKEAARLTKLLQPPRGKKKNGAKRSLADLLKLTADQPVSAADIALFGRMTTSYAFRDVEAACQVADAISTHPVDIETDYFTTVDDLDTGTGAAHVGEANFASAVFYHNLVVDFDELLRNLGARIPAGKEDDANLQAIAAEAPQTACRAIEGLLRAVMHNVPTGKINSHAHNQPPSLILVEVKRQKLATNYLTAFHDPARRGNREDGSTDTLLSSSVRKLLTFARYRDRKMKTDGTQRFLFLNDPDSEAAFDHLRESLTEGNGAELTDDTFFANSSLRTCDGFDTLVAAVNKAVTGSDGENEGSAE